MPQRGAVKCVKHKTVGDEAFPLVVAAIVDGAVHTQLGKFLVLSWRRNAVNFGDGGFHESNGRDADTTRRCVN